MQVINNKSNVKKVVLCIVFMIFVLAKLRIAAIKNDRLPGSDLADFMVTFL